MVLSAIDESSPSLAEVLERPIRSLFISDVHLGNKYAKADFLLHFLSAVREKNVPRNLYIVGDFIDGWRLKRNWFWTNDSNLILRKILSLVKVKTNVYYITGNHDDFLRTFIADFNDIAFGSIQFKNEFVHQMVDGRKMLVIHGDRFDFMTKHAKWLRWVGDQGYHLLLNLNLILNLARRWFGMKYWSLGKAIKKRVGQAQRYINDFEHFLSGYAVERNCKGVICGHIHVPAIKAIDDVLYCNTGDWMESCSALIEYEDGKLQLYFHHKD